MIPVKILAVRYLANASPALAKALGAPAGYQLLILYYKRIVFKSLYDKMAEYRKQAEKYGVRLHGDVSATLRELRGLQKDGLITQEEYEEYKKTLKGRL